MDKTYQPTMLRKIVIIVFLLFLSIIGMLIFMSINIFPSESETGTQSVVMEMPIDSASLQVNATSEEQKKSFITNNIVAAEIRSAELKEAIDVINRYLSELDEISYTALKKRPLYNQYQQCIDNAEGSCHELFSAVLYEAADLEIKPAISAMAMNLSVLGDDALIKEALTEILDSNSDPVRSVEVLLIVRNDPDLSATHIPDSVYQDLDKKMTIESQLILQELFKLPGAESKNLLNEIADKGGNLKSSLREIANHTNDTRLLSASLALVGKQKDSVFLDELVLHYQQNRNEEWVGWKIQIPEALGVCGMPCYSITSRVIPYAKNSKFLVEVLRSTDFQDRRAMLAALEAGLTDEERKNVYEEIDM